MQSGLSIAHHFRIAAANWRQSAARFAPDHPSYCYWLCGQRITILDRPLVESEWELMRAFVCRLKPIDINLRFGRALDLTDEPTLRRYFSVRANISEMTWVGDENDAILGVAHSVIISPSEAEIALLVRSDLKHLGTGELLLRHLLARSARQGLKKLSARVLRENRPVLQLASKLGYTPRDATQWDVEIVFDVHRAEANSGLAPCKGASSPMTMSPSNDNYGE